ncbi:MAG: pyruvate kinase [Rhodospirillaceae bacterium]|nr:pyruvate kinase [Rhodospirillaceae bacterium]|tara:strand:+ start:974 stop:2407 length:1434 start_codon:yes stop_codon:yes gene_type:complete
MSRTGIVCTIGPRSLDDSKLLSMWKKGMTVARLNGSHNNLDWHSNAVKIIRDTLPELPILLDIPGRKIRTTQLQHEPEFKIGEQIILTTDITYKGKSKVPVNYESLHEFLKPNHIILADDGTLRFTVNKVEGRDIYCEANTEGKLKSAKGINVPFVPLNIPEVTPKDELMVEFACNINVDFIGLSFVESAAHITAFKNLIGSSSPRIVAKVENQGGLDKVNEIAREADAIMVDRGDLSVETSLFDVALFQKQIINAASKFGRPVIIATEMLHTMIENPFPTKAEVSDITNAVIDGCAATMLSGETAVGDYPQEAICLMNSVAHSSEEFVQKKLDLEAPNVGDTIPEVMGEAIKTLCRALPITKIVAITRSGFAARMIAVHMPTQPIIAVSDDASAARSFNLFPGTQGVYSNTPFPKENINHFGTTLEMLWRRDLLVDQDLVLATGVTYPHTGNRMNAVQINSISHLRASLNWDKNKS